MAKTICVFVRKGNKVSVLKGQRELEIKVIYIMNNISHQGGMQYFYTFEFINIQTWGIKRLTLACKPYSDHRRLGI